MTHANAALTPRHRFKVARLVVEDGHPISEVAARFQVSWPTVKRWVDRYVAGESMLDRSSRPKTSPARTSRTVTKRCVSLRMRLREGPVQLAARLEIAPSTVHRILTIARLNRLSYIDRATGEPVRRYEHPHPGSLVHVDVKKIGNIPDGGESSCRPGTGACVGLPHGDARRHRVQLPLARSTRHQPADAEPPPEEARRCRTRDPREARPVGSLRVTPASLEPLRGYLHTLGA